MTKAAMFNPESFVEGGLVDDVDVVFTECGFAMFDYGGKANAVPAFRSKLVYDGEETEQFWSAGRAEDWVPSDDGTKLISVGSATALSASSNFAMLITSLVNAGFPVEQLGDDISVLENLAAHVIRVVVQRKGLEPRYDDKGQEKKSTVLTISEILTLPWENSAPKKKAAAGRPGGRPGAGAGTGPKKAAKPAAAKKPAAKPAPPKPAPTPASDGDDAIEFLTTTLADVGALEKKDLPSKVFEFGYEDTSVRLSVIQTVMNDEFLASHPDLWSFDGNVITIAE